MINLDKTLLYITNVSCLKDKNIFDKAYKLLNKDRKNKVDKYISDSDKYLSIGAYLLFIHSLKDINYDNKIDIIYGENGKPYLKSNDIYFNISHSGEYALCAISKNEVGCDIEKIRDINIDIAKRYFNNSEYQSVLNNKDNPKKFFEYWTLKESFMKYTGLGLKLPLDSFEIIMDEDIDIKQNIIKKTINLFTDEIDGYEYSVCFEDNAIELRKILIEDMIK